MHDAMTMHDGFAMQMDCGHPNTKPGEKCKLCGQHAPIVVHHGKPPSDLEDQVEKQAEGHKKPEKVDNMTIEASDVGSLDDVLPKEVRDGKTK